MTDNPNTRQAALDYHALPKPGKLEIRATKPLANGRDLARAYSPGVAEACLEIQKDPSTAALYTSRANLVAVVTNGTAVLGLGNIGPLASKPVMEGKAVLFKKFANIDTCLNAARYGIVFRHSRISQRRTLNLKSDSTRYLQRVVD